MIICEVSRLLLLALHGSAIKLNVRHAQPRKHKNICITFIQRLPNVFDVGPTLYKCYTNGGVVGSYHVCNQRGYILKEEAL